MAGFRAGGKGAALAEAGAPGWAPALTSGGGGRREGPQQQQQRQHQRGARRHLGQCGPGVYSEAGHCVGVGVAPPPALGPGAARTPALGRGDRGAGRPAFPAALRAEEAAAGEPWLSKADKGFTLITDLPRPPSKHRLDSWLL